MKGFIFAAILAVSAVCLASEPAQAQCANGSCSRSASGYSTYSYATPVRSSVQYIRTQKPVRTYVYGVGNYIIQRQPVRSTIRRVWVRRPGIVFGRSSGCANGSCRR